MDLAGSNHTLMPHLVSSARDAPNTISACIPGLDRLWRTTTGDAKIKIALLDGPIDLAHPCFSGAKLTLLETIAPNNGDLGARRHGTHVASVIFGQHRSPVVGIAPLCSGLIIPLYRVGERTRLGRCSQLELAEAILLAVEHGASIINVSGGEHVLHGEVHAMLVDAVRVCAARGVVIVAAAGNEGCDCVHAPAALESVLAVGAMGCHGSPLRFSNWGAGYRTAGILAPGREILGALPGGAVARQSGTSFATAVVSGIAALLLSLQRRLGRRPDAYEVRDLLLATAIGCDVQPYDDCRRLLAGRLNVIGAHSRLEEGEGVGMSEQYTESISDVGGDELPPTAVLMDAIDQSPAPAASLMASSHREMAGAARYSAPPRAEGVAPSGSCECGGNKGRANGKTGGATEESATKARQPIYVLGQIGYDLRSETRRDSLQQHTGTNVTDPLQLAALLQRDPSFATSVTWTLNVDATPVYAIHPVGAFAARAYERLREFLVEQVNGSVERVSIPGTIGGIASLISGMQVPIIVPELRGMYSWSTSSLVASVSGEKAASSSVAEGVQAFLERVYYELRNLGITPQDRAMNFAATNAFQVGQVYGDALREGLHLDKIEVERSPICKPGSDCWDVKLTFFHPSRRLEQARAIYRFTVDVGDVVPVTVGKVRKWHVY